MVCGYNLTITNLDSRIQAFINILLTGLGLLHRYLRKRQGKFISVLIFEIKSNLHSKVHNGNDQRTKTCQLHRRRQNVTSVLDWKVSFPSILSLILCMQNLPFKTYFLHSRHSDIIENKSTKAYFIDKKKLAWQKVVEAYNSAAETGPRTEKQLKVLYDNFKRENKTKIADEHVSLPFIFYLIMVW